MDRFKKLGSLGSGSFGDVFKAIDKQTGKLVAIKILKEKIDTWENAMKMPEIRAFLTL
jgi:protein kinase